MRFAPEWLRERRFWRRAADRDVDDELAFHLAMRAELLQDAGLDAQTARDLALQRFGDLAGVREHCLTISHQRERRMKRLEIWSALDHNVRYAVRRLRGAPGFAAAVVLMMALGIGATTTVFSVVNGILLRPLPFQEPERLVQLSHTIALAGRSTLDQSDGTFLLYQRHATAAFESMGAYRTRDVNLGATGDGSGAAERAAAATVTSGFFRTLRVAPSIGRVLQADDDRLGAPRVVVLSTALWKGKFGGDPAAVGRHLVIDGTEREIVGVMPESFRYPSQSTALWLPLAFDPAHAQAANFNFQAVARLRPGVERTTAVAELEHYLPRLLEEFPTDVPPEMWAEAHVRPVVTPLRDVIVGDTSRLLWILFGAVGLLLLIACANVASLFMVRAEGAQRDVAVRMALGAGNGAVFTQYLLEALLLAGGGGALGVLLAVWGIRALGASPDAVDLPRLAEVGVDARVVLFAMALATLSAVAVSLTPVLRARRVSPGIVLKESSRSATVGRDRQRVRSALVIAQVALALVLVAGSTLMARSFARLRNVEPGFNARGVLTMRVALPRGTYDAAARAGFFQRLLEAARALAGVLDVAVGDWLPLTDDSNDSVVTIEDHPLVGNAVPPDHLLTYVSPGYFAALGIPLLSGQTFAAIDPAKPSTDVVVSHAFAERYWKGQNPIGKRLRPGLDGPWFTIIGVAGDVHMRSLERAAEELIYFPLVTPDADEPSVPGGVAIVIRSSGDPTLLTPALRGLVHGLDPALPTYDERPMTARLAASAARTRFVMLTLGIASLVALLIGMVGLYGVLAYSVTLRRHEIGVRMALGATARDVTGMIARRGIVLAAAGIALGLLGAVAMTRVLHGLLYGVSPTDPAALAGTCLVLLAVASIASVLPARRAAGIDPMEALRRD